MGGLFSKPKFSLSSPAIPVITHIGQQQDTQQPLASRPSASTLAPLAAGGEPRDPQPADPVITAQQRVETVLRRTRGSAGTVLTGLRGVFERSDAYPARKSLLGE